MSKAELSEDKPTLLTANYPVKRPRIRRFFMDTLTLANRTSFPFREEKRTSTAFVLPLGTTGLDSSRRCAMRHSLISNLAILLIAGAFSLAGHAQQLPCPLYYGYTNSAEATNSIYCDIVYGTFDNTGAGILTNLQGGTLAIQQATLLNEGAIGNQAGASISLTFAEVDNSAGFWNGGWMSVDTESFVYNNGFFYNSGTIQNQRAVINEPAGFMENSGTILVNHKLENDGVFINLPFGQISIFQSFQSFGLFSRIENAGYFGNYGSIVVAGDGAS